MGKIFIIFCFLVNLYARDTWDGKVHIFGNMEKTLKYEGYGETISLKKFQDIPSLYAIGLVEHLQGEIQIFDSKAYITTVKKEGGLHINRKLDKKGVFLVYTRVPQWVSFKVPDTVYTKKQFEEYLNETADEYGIDTYEPFPFLLEGKIKANKYRVFTHNPNDTIVTYGGTCACNLVDEKDGSKKKYIPSSLSRTMTDSYVTILGFHVLQRGTITDRYSYTNMNFITKDKRLAGHCQNIMIGERMTLKLPKIR